MKEHQPDDIELQDILLNVKDVQTNTKEEEEINLLSSKLDITPFISTEESDIIKADMALLKEMGYDQKMINKVYIIISPPNIETAIDIMTPVNGIYHHDFFENIYQSKNKNLCFICNKPRNCHINSTPGDNEEIFDNIIDENNNKNIIINDIKKNNLCKVCYEEIIEDQKNLKLNSPPCGHQCCKQCLFNYLKSKISEAKVESIKCFEYKCNQILPQEFIYNHIKEDKILLKQYEKFKLRAEILKDPNKRQCPNPGCEKFLQKSENKYVKCENGHKYCFECLRPWHGKDTCEKSLEKDFINWKKNKNIKRCPRCKIYTEKNEGCNHMICSNCKFQWCWLCEGKYEYGHYNQGKCKGLQFSKAWNIEEVNRISCTERCDRFCFWCDRFCQKFCDKICQIILFCPYLIVYLICVRQP